MIKICLYHIYLRLNVRSYIIIIINVIHAYLYQNIIFSIFIYQYFYTRINTNTNQFIILYNFNKTSFQYLIHVLN